MTRFRASGLHLLISLAVGLALLALSWFVWYPAPMLWAIGGHEIFLLVVGIDVILGPLLTLVIFKSGKKYLKLDLLVIAALQIGAMQYGVSTLLEARPVYVAALGEQFQVVQATEVIEANLVKTKTTLPWWGPIWVGTKAPTDRYDVDAVDAITGVGGGRGHLPQLHIPYKDMTSEVLAKAHDVSALIKLNVSKEADIRSWLASHGCDEKTTKYQPIKISSSMFAIVLDAKSAEVIGIIPFVLTL